MRRDYHQPHPTETGGGVGIWEWDVEGTAARTALLAAWIRHVGTSALMSSPPITCLALPFMAEGVVAEVLLAVPAAGKRIQGSAPQRVPSPMGAEVHSVVI